jgi:hypothetical protein
LKPDCYYCLLNVIECLISNSTLFDPKIPIVRDSPFLLFPAFFHRNLLIIQNSIVALSLNTIECFIPEVPLFDRQLPNRKFQSFAIPHFFSFRGSRFHDCPQLDRDPPLKVPLRVGLAQVPAHPEFLAIAPSSHHRFNSNRHISIVY